MIYADKVLKDVVVSEKATALQSENQYTFKVNKDANADMVKRSVEKTFEVKVARVNIMNVKPKRRPDRRRRGVYGVKSGYKKAIVTLVQGDSLDLA